MAQDLETIKLLMPWLPDELAQAFADEWVDTGDATLALAAMRQSPNYDTYFAGNRRDDGSLRYSEQQYKAVTEAFDAALLSNGVDPTHFQGRYADLIAGDVSPAEFVSRVEGVASRVLEQSDQLRQVYADYYNLDLTNEAIIASVLDPTVGDALLNRRVAVADIGAQAALKGFGIDFEQAQRITDQGITAQQAADVFGQAIEQLPVLDVLARRHNDPNDTFDLNDFLQASVFNDPEERRRIRRLLQEESSTFSRTGQTVARSSSGAVTGLSTQR